MTCIVFRKLTPFIIKLPKWLNIERHSKCKEESLTRNIEDLFLFFEVIMCECAVGWWTWWPPFELHFTETLTEIRIVLLNLKESHEFISSSKNQHLPEALSSCRKTFFVVGNVGRNISWLFFWFPSVQNLKVSSVICRWGTWPNIPVAFRAEATLKIFAGSIFSLIKKMTNGWEQFMPVEQRQL